MTEVVLTVKRAALLTANERLHWRTRAAKTKALRHLSRLLHRGVEPMQRARLDVTIAYPDRRRRDRHNLWPTVKACVDGAVDAGVLPDDDDAHLDGPHLETAAELSGGGYRFTFAWSLA